MNVSIAMCTYNKERYVREQLDSFLAQKRQPDELVICDDGSTDTTIAIVNDFARHAPFPVRLHINETNQGVRRNFERSVGMTTGDIVVLSDDDDVWFDEKIARMVEIFESRPEVGIVFSNATIGDSNLQRKGFGLWESARLTSAHLDRIDAGQAMQVYFQRYIGWGATFAFRGALREHILPFPDRWGHDGWIAAIALALSEAAVIREPMMIYRNHGSNMAGAFPVFTKNPGAVMDRARNPRKKDYEIKLTRWTMVKDRVAQVENYPKKTGILALLDEKCRHLQTRVDLYDHNRLQRFPIAMRELLTGRYQRYSSGVLGFARDTFF